MAVRIIWEIRVLRVCVEKNVILWPLSSRIWIHDRLQEEKVTEKDTWYILQIVGFKKHCYVFLTWSAVTVIHSWGKEEQIPVPQWNCIDLASGNN